MYCEKCGKEQKEGQKFCPQCGTPFVQQEEKDVSEKEREPNEIEIQEEKANLEDTSLPADSIPQQLEEGVSKVKNRSQWKRYLIYGLIAVVAIALVTAECNRRQHDKIIAGCYDFGGVKALSLKQMIYVAKKRMNVEEISDFYKQCGLIDTGEEPNYGTIKRPHYFYSGTNTIHYPINEVKGVNFFYVRTELSKSGNRFNFSLPSSHQDYFDLLVSELGDDMEWYKDNGVKKKKGRMTIRIIRADYNDLGPRNGSYHVIVYIDWR